MKITNKYNLPKSIVNICEKAIGKPEPNVIRCTELIAPVQVRRLKQEHWDKLEQDCSDMLWAIFGKASHAVLEGHAPDSAIVEAQLSKKINGVTITGTPDLLDDGEVQDWKFTSVWSFLLGEKIEWEQQLNVYAWLYRSVGMEVKSAAIYAFLRDWVMSKAKADKDYPKVPFIRKPINLWSFQEQDKYVGTRLILHFEDKTVPCTPAEQWKKPDTWAVKKKGQQKAVRVFDSQDKALKFIADSPDISTLFFEWRQGGLTRCENYCIVKPYCPQFAAEAKASEPHPPAF